MATNGRVIVGCTPGEEDPDRVLVAYLTAGAALDQGKEVVMWLTAKGVRLALNGYGERIRADQDPPVKRVHAQFIDKGGRFYVCPICFNERHLDQDDLGGLQVRRQPAAAQGVGRRHGDPQRPPSGGPTAPPRAASRPTSSPPKAATSNAPSAARRPARLCSRGRPRRRRRNR
jgi:predicted peroxiredoxin